MVCLFVLTVTWKYNIFFLNTILFVRHGLPDPVPWWTVPPICSWRQNWYSHSKKTHTRMQTHTRTLWKTFVLSSFQSVFFLISFLSSLVSSHTLLLALGTPSCWAPSSETLGTTPSCPDYRCISPATSTTIKCFRMWAYTPHLTCIFCCFRDSSK